MIKVLLILILFSTTCFSKEIDDYKEFAKILSSYHNNEFEKSLKDINKFYETHKDSDIIKSNFSHHYLGMIYYHNKDYENAIKYLKLAVYKPKKFRRNGYFKLKKNDQFEYKNLYYIAKSYENMNSELAYNYYKKLLKNYYNKELATFEKKALKRLALKEKKYALIYRIKYENRYDLTKNLSYDEIDQLNQYLFSFGKYKQVYINLKHMERIDGLSYKNKMFLLRNLFRLKKHQDVITYSKKFAKDTKNPSFYYYTGNSTRRLGNINGAIKYLKLVKTGYYKKYSEQLLARMYFLKKDYKTAIKYCKNIDHNNIFIYFDSLFKLKNYKAIDNALSRFKYSPLIDKYIYKLYTVRNDNKYLFQLIKEYPNSYYAELAKEKLVYQEDLKDYDYSKLQEKYKDLINNLVELKDLGYKSLAEIYLANIKIEKKDRFYLAALKSQIAYSNQHYHEGRLNALNYKNKMVLYKNLGQILYPLAHKKLIFKHAKANNIDPYLMYSIIIQESQFKPDLISSASAYGLMQIILPTAHTHEKGLTARELLKIEKNIEIGGKILGRLNKKYKGDIAKIAAAYNAGPGHVDRWIRRNKGKLIIENIPFKETNNYVKKVINNYKKYKLFYK